VYAVPGTVAADRVASYWKWRPLYDAVITNILGSLGLYFFTRSTRRRPQFILDVALVYEVLTALSVGILDYAQQGPTEGVSWIVFIILLFAPMVPSTPRKTLFTALLAASMGPLAALIWNALGVEPLAFRQILLLSIPNYLCAAMAPVVAHVITRLGREVREARAMGSLFSNNPTPMAPRPIGAAAESPTWPTQFVLRLIPRQRYRFAVSGSSRTFWASRGASRSPKGWRPTRSRYKSSVCGIAWDVPVGEPVPVRCRKSYPRSGATL
jgi:hypothetical protein